jgi:hypothetical protein
MITAWGKPTYSKPVPLPLCLPQIPCRLIQGQTQTSKVRGGHVTVLAMRSQLSLNVIFLSSLCALNLLNLGHGERNCKISCGHSCLPGCDAMSLLLDPEDEGNTVLRNLAPHKPHRCVNLKQLYNFVRAVCYTRQAEKPAN